MVAPGDPRGFYKLLGVHRTASAEEIRAAFRDRAKLYHPDGGSVAADQERFRLLREAYEVLRDPQRRLQYDAAGLAAERREEQARRGRDRPPGSAAQADAAQAPRPEMLDRSFMVRSLAWSLAGAGVMLVAALVALGILWDRLSHHDRTLAAFSERLGEMVAGDGDATAHVRAMGLVGLDAALARGRDMLAAGDVPYRTELVFEPGAADFGPQLREQLDRAVLKLDGAIDALPLGQDWLVVVEGRTPQAANASGLLIEAWELALLRVGTITEQLIRRGIPAERLAVRFQAGFTLAGADQAGDRTVELKLLCCRE